MHFILTAFGKDPLLQLTIAGWMMRLLEDNPVLPSPLMNVDNKDVFKQDESVDIIAEVLTNDELFRIWGELTDEPYQISVPYLARNIVIDSGTQANVVTPIISRTIQRNVSP
jgi:hypothetical protein